MNKIFIHIFQMRSPPSSQRDAKNCRRTVSYAGEGELHCAGRPGAFRRMAEEEYDGCHAPKML